MFDDNENRELWRVSSLGPEEAEQERQTRREPEYTPQQRRWAALGALKAALLIGAAYLVGLGIIIGLMVLFW